MADTPIKFEDPEWDHSVTPARPARVRTALISADYDTGMHGWRAHAVNRTCRVAWTSDTASLVMPWDEPSGACPRLPGLVQAAPPSGRGNATRMPRTHWQGWYGVG